MMKIIEVLHHEHPITRKDLNPEYPHDIVYDDEYDLISNQAFQCQCSLCCENITFLHRYYYKCDVCNYSLHKLCAESKTKLEHASHKIYHSGHKHPLIPISKDIKAKCDACGKEHNGVFYHCPKCVSYLINRECVFRVKRLEIEKETHGRYFHTHPLILTYSFPKEEQKAKFNPSCRICDNPFSDYENHWVYKCERCRYYVHLHCVNEKCKLSNTGTDITISDNSEVYPNVLRLPFTIETYKTISDFLFEKTNENSPPHTNHKHPLILVDAQCNDITTLSFRDLMNKNDALCNGCVRPITDEMVHYKCSIDGCNFLLHAWCTRLPAELKGLKGHPQHTLFLLPKACHNVLGAFVCNSCDGFCNGFAYACEKCSYYIDVICALIPKRIIHQSHPYDPLSRVEKRVDKDYCRMCSKKFADNKEVSLSCEKCHFHLHLKCAFALPQKIKHKYDKHLMTLTYSPAENYGGDQYYCEICEDELNPNNCYYHCHECQQSMHSSCVPSFHDSNTYIYDYGLSVTSVSGLVNIKFGSIHDTQEHEHPLSLTQGTESDGECTNTECHDRLNGFFILKCLHCTKFAVHIHHYWW